MAIQRSTGSLPNDFYKAEVWSALTLPRWYAEGLIPQIANTDYEGEIKKYGQLVHIRRDADAVISPYVIGTPLNYQGIIDEKTTLTIDYAYSAAHKIDKVDEAQMDINVMSKIAGAINKQFMTQENQVLFNAMPTLSYNPLNLSDKSGTLQVVTSTTANYILDGLIGLRTRFNRRRCPKEGRYVVVSPEVEDMLLRCDHVRYDVTGRENKVIETGTFNLRVAGFDVLVSEFVPEATAGTVWNCPAGIKGALTFARQLVDVSAPFELQDEHGKGIKALDVFGFALTQPDGFGVWKVKVA